MIWTGVTVKRTADFIAIIVQLPMCNPNWRKHPVILTPRSEAACVFQQIRESVDPGGGRGRIAREAYLDLRFCKHRRFVDVFCQFCPLAVSAARHYSAAADEGSCSPMLIAARTDWQESTTCKPTRTDLT